MLNVIAEQGSLNSTHKLRNLISLPGNFDFGFKFAGYACLSIVAVTACFFAVLDASAGVLAKVTVVQCLLLTILLCAYGAKLLFENKRCASKSFLIIGLPALLMFSWFILPDQVPDEIWHIYRALNIGWCGGPTLDVPDLLTYQQMPLSYVTYRDAIQVQDAWSHMHLVDRTLSSYYPHLYLFSGLLAAFGKFLNLNPLVVVWMARIGNACAFLVAGFITLNIIPIGRTTAFLYLLNPMLLELEASCSADAVLNMVACLFVAVFLDVLLKRAPSKQDFLLLGCLYILTSLSKQAYVLLGGFFIAFIWKYRDNRALKVFVAAGVGILFVCTALLLYLYPLGVDSELGYAIDLIRQPDLFLSVITKTIWEQLPFWISSFAGGSLGAFTVSTWGPCFWGYLIAVAVSIVYNEGDNERLLKQQRIVFCIYAAMLVIILTLPFRAWSVKVDGRSDIIQGVQGRYYLPFMLLPLVCLINPDDQIKRKGCYFRFGIFMTVNLFIVLLSIICTFI